MSKRRVVVTGVGTVNALANNIDETWGKLVKGENGIDHISLFDPSDYKSKVAGEVKNLNIDSFTAKELRQMDRYNLFALTAAEEAVEDSGFIKSGNFNSYRTGVITGVGIGGIETFREQTNTLFTKGPRRVSPLTIPMMISNIAPANISIKYDLKGINFTCSSACASGNHAIGTALRSIQFGDADVIVTGGIEAAVNPLSVAAFGNMKALTGNDNPQNASRPFDINRDGFVIAEGAGILILEEYNHAVERNAKIYAEVVGYGASCDAYHITAPDPEAKSGIQALIFALDDAELGKNSIDYISAHGTSTPLNDRIETNIINEVFGENAKNININSTKSMLGHSLGAAAGIEAVVCCKTIQTGKIHPTINIETPDPECYLNYTSGTAVERNVRYALSNTLGFGGHNSAIIFKNLNN